MITAEIKMGNDYTTDVHGDTIEEIIEKIKEYHTMTSFMKNHYSKKGRLESEMATGWYLKEENGN